MKFLKYFVAVIIFLPLLVFAKETDIYIGISAKYNPNDLPKIGLAGFYPKDEASEDEKQTAKNHHGIRWRWDFEKAAKKRHQTAKMVDPDKKSNHSSGSRTRNAIHSLKKHNSSRPKTDQYLIR
jgi:hypothetical protein